MNIIFGNVNKLHPGMTFGQTFTPQVEAEQISATGRISQEGASTALGFNAVQDITETFKSVLAGMRDDRTMIVANPNVAKQLDPAEMFKPS